MLLVVELPAQTSVSLQSNAHLPIATLITSLTVQKHWSWISRVAEAEMLVVEPR